MNNQLYMMPGAEYCGSPMAFSNVPDLVPCTFDDVSTDPSPSPPVVRSFPPFTHPIYPFLPMLQMYASLDNQYTTYSSASTTPYNTYAPTQPTIVNSIEFTDLTQIQRDDRRRRRSNNTLHDKEAASNMRIVSHPAPKTPPAFPCITIPSSPEHLHPCATKQSPPLTQSPPPAPPRPKPRLATRLPRAQRETRPALRERTRDPRKQAPATEQKLHRPWERVHQVAAGGRGPARGAGHCLPEPGIVDRGAGGQEGKGAVVGSLRSEWWERGGVVWG